MTGAAKRHACHAVPYDGAGSQRLRAAVFLAVFLAAFFAVFFVLFFTALRAAFLATLRGAAFRAVLAVFFDLNAIASIGSAVALIVFALVTLGHLRIRRDTGANLLVLLIADLSTIVVLVSFAATTLVDEPGTAVALAVILVLAVILDLAWKSRRPRSAATV